MKWVRVLHFLCFFLKMIQTHIHQAERCKKLDISFAVFEIIGNLGFQHALDSCALQMHFLSELFK